MMRRAIDNVTSSAWHMGRDPRTSGRMVCDWDSNLLVFMENFQEGVSAASMSVLCWGRSSPPPSPPSAPTLSTGVLSVHANFSKTLPRYQIPTRPRSPRVLGIVALVN